MERVKKWEQFIWAICVSETLSRESTLWYDSVCVYEPWACTLGGDDKDDKKESIICWENNQKPPSLAPQHTMGNNENKSCKMSGYTNVYLCYSTSRWSISWYNNYPSVDLWSRLTKTWHENAAIIKWLNFPFYPHFYDIQFGFYSVSAHFPLLYKSHIHNADGGYFHNFSLDGSSSEP